MLRPLSGRLSGRAVLAGFALGGAVVYLVVVLGVTLALGEELPAVAWAGFGVVVVVAAAAAGGLAVFLIRSSRNAGRESARHPGRAGTPIRRVLVVADAGWSGAALCDALASRASGRPLEVVVVAPSLVSPVRYLDSDLDAARAEAQARLDETIAALAAAGVPAQGLIGSESPLDAIADALATFPADEIIVAASGDERSNWLEQDVVERARELHGLPVSQLVLETPLATG